MAKSKGRTHNPKFGTSPQGQRAAQASPVSGMNVGGLTDAQVRANAAGVGVMLHQQLKKNKSASSPV
jgi:hypothetical protein